MLEAFANPQAYPLVIHLILLLDAAITQTSATLKSEHIHRTVIPPLLELVVAGRAGQASPGGERMLLLSDRLSRTGKTRPVGEAGAVGHLSTNNVSDRP